MSKKRLLLHGSNALILTVVVLGILVFVNYFALKEGGRLDLTKEKLFSISDKTKKLVNGLDKEVEIIGFFKELGLDKKQFVDLTNQYKRNSDKIIIKLVDPDKSPGLTNKYEVTEYSIAVALISKIVFGQLADVTSITLAMASLHVLAIGLLADLIDKRAPAME